MYLEDLVCGIIIALALVGTHWFGGERGLAVFVAVAALLLAALVVWGDR